MLVVLLTLWWSECDGGDGSAAQHDSAAQGRDTGTTRRQASDADNEFLRAVVNHDQGLVELAMVAIRRSGQDITKQSAHDLHERSLSEQTTMILLARSIFGEEITPTLAPAHRLAVDSLMQLTDSDFEGDFYRRVVVLDREALALTDGYLPRLRRAAVKRLAARIKRERAADTAAFVAQSR